MKKLPLSFYERENVFTIARELLGKVLVTRWDGELTSGRIVELEAYNGVIDQASHAYGGRRTPRNEVMYGKAGNAYVYLCYGIHHLFNVITNKSEVPHAVLIRALEPIKGLPSMLKRRKAATLKPSLTRGPGSLSEALGIRTHHNGRSLRSAEIYIADDGYVLPKSSIGASKRIGVEYSGKAAHYLYRYYIKGNPYVSGKPK